MADEYWVERCLDAAGAQHEVPDAVNRRMRDLLPSRFQTRQPTSVLDDLAIKLLADALPPKPPPPEAEAAS